MESIRLTQLTEFRDSLYANRQWVKLDTMQSFMSDFIHDMDLKNKLNNPVAAKAVWYCLCNNNADRNVLIGNLYNYFLKNGNDEEKALELTSMALFLGGKDSQLSKVSKPTVHASQGNNNRGNRGNKGKTFGGGNGHGGGINKKWIVGLGLAIALLLVVVWMAKSSGSDSSSSNLYSTIDVCRTYEGSIDNGDLKQTCKMSVSLKDQDELIIRVTNLYNQSDKKEYVGAIKKDQLKLEDGPDLVIKKTSKGKFTLNCNDENSGKWTFVSK